MIYWNRQKLEKIIAFETNKLCNYDIEIIATSAPVFSMEIIIYNQTFVTNLRLQNIITPVSVIEAIYINYCSLTYLPCLPMLSPEIYKYQGVTVSLRWFVHTVMALHTLITVYGSCT